MDSGLLCGIDKVPGLALDINLQNVLSSSVLSNAIFVWGILTQGKEYYTKGHYSVFLQGRVGDGYFR